MQLLPRPARPQDPAERLGISVASLQKAADFQKTMQQVCSAVAAGEIGIREAGRIARQVRTRMRALRRFARLQRRLLRARAKEFKTAPKPSSSGLARGSTNLLFADGGAKPGHDEEAKATTWTGR